TRAATRPATTSPAKISVRMQIAPSIPCPGAEMAARKILFDALPDEGASTSYAPVAISQGRQV
ncbi:MAG TPA: hypothetical protein VIK18_05580, partial [Pirellulales bacterium]